jgi:ubiquinone biosynthesis protein UbiJ
VIDAILQPLEQLLSRRLAEDPVLLAGLERLAGKVVEAYLHGIDLRVFVIIHAKGIHITRKWTGKPDVSVRGTPLAVLGLLKRGSEQVTQKIGAGVDVQGDLDVLQHIQRLAGDFDLDWEDLLAERIGDTAAYGIARIGRSFTRIVRTAHGSLEQSLSEYLRFELRYLPQDDEVESFVGAVDHLRSDVDRLDVRISRLRAKLGRGAP